MNDHDDVLTMVRRANPLPDVERFDPDEVAAGVAAIEEAWQADRRAPSARPLAVPRAHRRVRYTIAFVAAAVIALVFIGGPILLLNRQEAPVIHEPTTTMPTTVTTVPAVTTTGPATTTTATTTTIPLPPMPGITFAQGSEAEIPGAMIDTMIRGGPGLIAAGTLMACGVVDSEFVCNGDAGVWVSADGGPWQRAGDPKLFMGPGDTPLDGSGQWIFDVAVGPLGIVAVGEDESESGAAVWLSQDGIEWSRVPSSDELGGSSKMYGVAFDGTRVVAVGKTGGLYGSVWVSDDAVTWTRIEDPDFAGDGEPAAMDSLAVGPGGMIALGSLGFSEGYDQAGTRRPAIWVSPDGLEWDRLPEDDLAALGVDEIQSVRGGDTGFLMIGSPIDEDGVGLWTSSDGYTWERVYAPTMGPSPDGTDVTYLDTQWDGSRWVSVGFEPSTGTVWASFELGSPWQPVGSLGAEAPSDGFDIDGLIITETGLVIVTSVDKGDETARFVAWTGTWDE